MSEKKDFTPEVGNGFLFQSTQEKGSEYYGSYNHNGVMLDISGWIKSSKNGKGDWFSLAVWPKDVDFNDRVVEDVDKDAEGYKMRNNTGGLFESDPEKKTDYYGSFKINDEEVRVSGQLVKGNKGWFIKLNKSFFVTDKEKAEGKEAFKTKNVESGNEVV